MFKTLLQSGDIFFDASLGTNIVCILHTFSTAARPVRAVGWSGVSRPGWTPWDLAIMQPSQRKHRFGKCFALTDTPIQPCDGPVPPARRIWVRCRRLL